MGDGYVIDSSSKNTSSEVEGLRIRLSESDKSHLEKLNECLEYNKPIKIVKNYGIYENQKNLAEFSIYSKEIVNSLLKLGFLSGNKSCNEELIKFDNKDFTKNFILGLFDADGCISIYKGEKGIICCEWQIVSSYKMVTKIKEFLIKEIPGIKFQKISKNSTKKDNNLYRIRIGSKKSVKLLYNYFYKSNCSDCYLIRKYLKMKSINDII